MKEAKELTPRQWALKRFLDDGVYEHWYSKEEICEALPEHYKLNHDPRIHDKCITIYQDFKVLQTQAPVIQKIIISNSKGHIKFGNREETKKYCDNIHNKAMKLLELESLLIRKSELDNQMRIINGEVNPDVITPESKARDFYQVFPNK